MASINGGTMKRRTLLKGTGLAITGIATMGGLGSQVFAASEVSSKPDTAPLDHELDKYPRCVICNMDRRKFHFSRHLLHYADQHAAGTCSINCTSEVMLRERKRGFKAIYAADFGVAGEPKPLVEASAATYLIGSSLRAVMSPVSKYAFAQRSAAEAVMSEAGGQLASFDEAVAASLDDYAKMVTQQYAKDRQL